MLLHGCEKSLNGKKARSTSLMTLSAPKKSSGEKFYFDGFFRTHLVRLPFNPRIIKMNLPALLVNHDRQTEQQANLPTDRPTDRQKTDMGNFLFQQGPYWGLLDNKEINPKTRAEN